MKVIKYWTIKIFFITLFISAGVSVAAEYFISNLSLILFGGLFGFWGMLLGVPVFTIIYSLITAAINNSLEKKGIPRARYLYPKDPFTSSPKKKGKRKPAGN